MTETKHSPTPWKVSAFNKTNIVDSIGRWVCDCTDPHLETATANTRLIVSAVNGHDKLVKALKESREYFDAQYDHDDQDTRPTHGYWVELIDKALAEAGEK